MRRILSGGQVAAGLLHQKIGVRDGQHRVVRGGLHLGPAGGKGVRRRLRPKKASSGETTAEVPMPLPAPNISVP